MDSLGSYSNTWEGRVDGLESGLNGGGYSSHQRE
jgi:hypothetical protein